MATVAPFGSWKSPITPDKFSKGNCKSICELQATDSGVFWIEQCCETGKRLLYFQGSEEKERWAPEQSVQNCVHEYGGGSFVPTPEGGIIFCTVEGLFEQKQRDSRPEQIANAEQRIHRFADCTVTSTHVAAVYEHHFDKSKDPENMLISINRNTKEQRIIARGADFYASPRFSPDGKQLVWMQWNHVNMPWDETSICLANFVSDGSIAGTVVIKDGVGCNTNYYSPSFGTDGSLWMVNDKTNFWNVYKVDINDEKYAEENMYPVDREIGYPLWQFSDRPYAASGQHLIMNVDGQLVFRNKDNVRNVDIAGFNVFSHLSLTNDGFFYCIGYGPSRSSSLIKVDLKDMSSHIVREARDASELAEFDISLPETVSFESDGVLVSGYFYSPKNSEYVAPDGDLPPVVVMGHGGPTAPAMPSLDLKKQFLTSRGFAVFDVNYRGSTGFGSAFRNMLKGQWGIVDRDDMINGARALVEKGLVNKDKVCISGSSAGGYLALSCLVSSDVFKAAVSIYGVADLVGLVKDTHKFERGYNEVLLGKYPEDAHIYTERSPINHISKLNTPIAFIHGAEDTVVPVQQSVTMYEEMKKKGVTTALMLFEDEGHGFRGALAVKKCTEASYFFMCKALDIDPSVESDIKIVNTKPISKS